MSNTTTQDIVKTFKTKATEDALEILEEKIPQKILELKTLQTELKEAMKGPKTKRLRLSKTESMDVFDLEDKCFDDTMRFITDISNLLNTIHISVGLNQPSLLESDSFESGVQEEFNTKLAEALMSSTALMSGDSRETRNEELKYYQKKYSNVEDIKRALMFQWKQDGFCLMNLQNELCKFLLRLLQMFEVNSDSLRFIGKINTKKTSKRKAKIRETLLPLELKSPTSPHFRSNLRSSGGIDEPKKKK